MIDIKYHIYSIAAIFFALALGIVIGTSFSKNAPPSEREQKTITRYENSMRVLRAEIDQATRKASEKEKLATVSAEFCESLLPKVVQNKLAYRNIAIIQTGDYDELSAAVKETLESAGASVNSVTDISRTFPFEDDKRVADVLTEMGASAPGKIKQPVDKLMGIISETLYSARYPEMLTALEQAGTAKFTGDYGKYNRLAVIVGGAKTDKRNTARLLDSVLIERLKQAGFIVVACEGMCSDSSYIPTWHKMGIATIDNVDTAMGQLSLVYALNGEKAQFGVKETADRVVPRGLEED